MEMVEKLRINCPCCNSIIDVQFDVEIVFIDTAIELDATKKKKGKKHD